MYDRAFKWLLFIVAGVLAAYVAYLGTLVFGPRAADHRDLLQPLAVALVGLLGVGGVVLQLQAAARREQAQYEKLQENVTAALRAEMRSIMTIISDARIPEQFAVRFVYPDGKFLWADAARTEDYLTVYKALSAQFGLIKACGNSDAPTTIARVVDFYNYFKAARDATAPLRQSPDTDTVRQASKGVVLLLQRMFEAGEAIGLSDPRFTASREVMDGFRKLVEADPKRKNDEIAALWCADAAFAEIPEALFPAGQSAPAAIRREPPA